MNKTKRFGILVVILLVGTLLAMTTTASAYIIHGYAKDLPGGEHSVVFQIPHNTPQYWLNGATHTPLRPFHISGVTQWKLNTIMYFLGDHKDPQLWDFVYRKTVSSNWDETALLVPTRYTWIASYGSEIYLDFGDYGWRYG